MAVCLCAGVPRVRLTGVLSVQLGSSRRAWLLLVSYAVVALGFGLIAVYLRDWVAGVFCLAGSFGASRMVVLLRRRAGLEAQAVPTVRGRSSAHAADGSLFVSLGHETVGARIREGVVLFAPSTAAFVCVGGWTHLVWKLLAAPFRTGFKFVDLAIDVPSHGDVGSALHDAIARHGGFIIDNEWTIASSQRWLLRPGGGGVVWIQRSPPESLTARWLPVPPPTPEQFRRIRNRLVMVGSGAVAVLGVAGVAAWRLTGDADYLVAGLAYAALVGGAVAAGLVVAQRRIAPADPAR